MTRFITVLDSHPKLGRMSAWVAALPLVGGLWTGLLSNPKELERFFKFAIVGIIGFVVDMSVFNIMKYVFETIGLAEGWNMATETRQIQLTLANSCSFTAAVLSNFTWNRLWTFPESRERHVVKQLLQFAIVNILGWGINTLLLLVMDQFVFRHFVGQRLSSNLAKAVATVVVLFWNFGVNRLWTYRGIK